jgi:PAS domain S-box-containing protein
MLSRALMRAGEAASETSMVHVHFEALTEALPERLLAIRTVVQGGRTVEIACASSPFVGGADLVVRLHADTRKSVLAGGVSGVDVPIETGGTLFGVITVEHGATTPDDDVELALSIDVSVVTQFARQLAALFAIARRRQGIGTDAPRRVIPLTPVAPMGFGNELRALFDGTREVVAVLDRNGAVRSGNKAMAEMLQCAPERLDGQSFLDLVAPDDRRRTRGALWSGLKGHATLVEVSIVLPGAEGVRTMALTFSPVRDASSVVLGSIVIGRDVTDQRMREEQLARADKLASVGRLAASVVHEINNPLTAILAYSDQFMRRSSPNSDPRDVTRAAHIVEAAERIRSLVRRLLAYAPSVTERPAVFSMVDVASQAVQFCEHVLREHGVILEVRAARDIPDVVGLRGELTQVFVNLVTNACHAAPARGGRIEVLVTSNGDNVRVAVRDNGHGINARDVSRIFEPFYTTKGNGQGTGLGLSIVRSILEQHQATLAVDSAVGVGTTFTIDFPVRGCDEAHVTS